MWRSIALADVGRGDPEHPESPDRGLEPGLVGLDQGESGGPGEAPRPEVTKHDVPAPVSAARVSKSTRA